MRSTSIGLGMLGAIVAVDDRGMTERLAVVVDSGGAVGRVPSDRAAILGRPAGASGRFWNDGFEADHVEGRDEVPERFGHHACCYESKTSAWAIVAATWDSGITKSVECRTINDVLQAYLPDRVDINLFTIDIEGLDYKILYDMSPLYRSWMIITEVLGNMSMMRVQASPIVKLLESRGYVLFSKLHFSALFVDREKLPASYAE
jgi:hypothetical protein